MDVLPRIDFATFLISLGTSAHIQLGAIADPTTGKVNQNLEGARQTIDILEMIEEKTRGNLNAQEAELIKNLLYELRLSFVEKRK